MRASSADPHSVKKTREEVVQAREQIPLQPMVKTMMNQAVPLYPINAHRGAVSCFRNGIPNSVFQLKAQTTMQFTFRHKDC